MLSHGHAVYDESFALAPESSTRERYVFINPDKMDDQIVNPAAEPTPIATPVEPAEPVETPESPEVPPAA